MRRPEYLAVWTVQSSVPVWYAAKEGEDGIPRLLETPPLGGISSIEAKKSGRPAAVSALSADFLRLCLTLPFLLPKSFCCSHESLGCSTRRRQGKRQENGISKVQRAAAGGHSQRRGIHLKRCRIEAAVDSSSIDQSKRRRIRSHRDGALDAT